MVRERGEREGGKREGGVREGREREGGSGEKERERGKTGRDNIIRKEKENALTDTPKQRDRERESSRGNN